MLNIFATSLLTATRLNAPNQQEAPEPDAPKRGRWLPAGHWWINSARDEQIGNR